MDGVFVSVYSWSSLIYGPLPHSHINILSVSSLSKCLTALFTAVDLCRLSDAGHVRMCWRGGRKYPVPNLHQSGQDAWGEKWGYHFRYEFESLDAGNWLEFSFVYIKQSPKNGQIVINIKICSNRIKEDVNRISKSSYFFLIFWMSKLAESGLEFNIENIKDLYIW